MVDAESLVDFIVCKATAEADQLWSSDLLDKEQERVA